VNPVMERMTGFSAADVLRRSPRELFPHHLKRHNMIAVLERAMSGETVRTGDLQFSVPQTGLAGWMMGTCTPHYDGAGSIDGVIGGYYFGRDVPAADLVLPVNCSEPTDLLIRRAPELSVTRRYAAQPHDRLTHWAARV
jgi:PAS domain-containing protein